MGEWRGYRPLPPGEDETLWRNVAGVRLTLRAGGKFDLVDGGLPFAGRWRRKDGTLEFDVESIMGRPLGAEPMAKKAAGAFGGTIRADAIEFRTLSGTTATLRRESP